jgi:uncharacterized membrane protein
MPAKKTAAKSAAKSAPVKKTKSSGEAHITMDRLVLIIALVALIAVSGVIGFILGIVASPLDFNSNPTVVTGK